MRIVVGIDGSSHAQRALRWALNRAARDESRVTVMYAYPPPRVGPGEALPSDFEVRESAKRLVEEAIAGAYPAQGVDVEPLVRPVTRSPAAALLEEAKSADLLVLGSRGLGGFMALRLGSVSAQCAEHAPCPVVILPPTSSDA